MSRRRVNRVIAAVTLVKFDAISAAMAQDDLDSTQGLERRKDRPDHIQVADKITGNQVYIKVTHAGLCHTDLGKLNVDMVLGHEPVGIVEETGPDCKRLRKGDVVGWGYLHNSCNECEFCWTGREILCPKREMYGTADLNFGGFGTGAVLRENYVYKIPKGLSPANAAVLQCAGATVFSALYNNKVKPTGRVGIVGIGGLGHLAIQFAKAWGCHVTAFSTTDSKRDEAMKFGAHEFVVTKVPEGETFKVEEKLDIILSTVSGQLPWEQYYKVLKASGTVVTMGLSDDPKMTLPYGTFIAMSTRWSDPS
ncbi:hypothetical protein MRB53_039139 [Persea americana]|nr:hypothetical protein MRB53_039139 [Persea americana]